MSLFELTVAESPLVISVPHDGALIPEEITKTMNHEVIGSSDRDYLIGDVFDFAELSYSKIKANYSRHVIDLNRPATGEALYQNQTETELCPTSTFDFKDIYLKDCKPEYNEIQRRINSYWKPYHDQLNQLIQSAREKYGWCLLIDAHSIDDEVPRFFEGKLPDINVGTFGGKSCSPIIASTLLAELNAQKAFSHVINGRFKGGFITRNYGQPTNGIHAIQLEHAKSSYLDQNQVLSEKSNELKRFWQQTLQHLIDTNERYLIDHN